MGIFKFGRMKNASVEKVDLNQKPAVIISEAYRALSTNVAHAADAAKAKTIMVTSAIAGEGKTTVASDLAIAMSRAGERVLLIDADIHHPEIGTRFRIPADHAGLSDVLLKRVDTDGYISVDEASRVSVMPVGTEAGLEPELLGSDIMLHLIQELEGQYDRILIDVAAVNAYADASVLAKIVDAAILVVRQFGANREEVFRAKQQLDAVDVKVIGTVLSHVNITENRHIANRYRRAYGTK